MQQGGAMTEIDKLVKAVARAYLAELARERRATQ